MLTVTSSSIGTSPFYSNLHPHVTERLRTPGNTSTRCITSGNMRAYHCIGNCAFLMQCSCRWLCTAWHRPPLPRQISTEPKPFAHLASAKCTGSLQGLKQTCLHQTNPPLPISNCVSNPHTPPFAHHIRRAQRKLFGHALRALENCLERNCCFTKSFLYRGGVVGSGLKRGRPRIHGAAQCAIQAWHWLHDLPNTPAQRHPQFPFAFVQFHRLAVHAQFWSRQVELPTCRKYLKQTRLVAFSQRSHSAFTARPQLSLAYGCIRLYKKC